MTKTKKRLEVDWELGYKVLEKKLEYLDRYKFWSNKYSWTVVKPCDFVGQILKEVKA